MDDNDFVTEVARRINTFFEQNEERARAALMMPIHQAGYASVAQLFGELCMPKGITKNSDPAVLADKLILIPKIEDQQLTGVEVLTMTEFQERAGKSQKPPVH